MAACCYFGANLCNQLDLNFPYGSTHGNSYSSSDLLPSSVALRLLFFYKFFYVQLPHLHYIPQKKIILSPILLSSLLFLDTILGPISFPLNYSKTVFLSWRQTQFNLQQLFKDNVISCLRRKSASTFQN